MSTNSSSSKGPSAASYDEATETTTNQWLHEHGYKSLHQFMVEYGFKPHSDEDKKDAERLVASFQKEEQDDAAEEDKQAEGKRVSASEKKTSQEDIDLAWLWHLRTGHVDWESLKRMPSMVRGMPELNFRIEDMPPCDACIQVHGPLGAAHPPSNF